MLGISRLFKYFAIKKGEVHKILIRNKVGQNKSFVIICETNLSLYSPRILSCFVCKVKPDTSGSKQSQVSDYEEEVA